MATPMYHINDDDEVMPCTASKKPCQFKKESSDGKDNHYYSKTEAYDGLADRFDERDILAGTSKRKVFTVEDNWGDKEEFVGGELTEDVESFFRQGQCIALASELSRALGSNQVAVVTQEEELDELIEDENGDIVVDENGDPVVGTRDIIFHAYAVSKGGQNFYDVDGPILSSKVKGHYAEGSGYAVRYHHVDEAGFYEGDMGDQNYEFAATFTKEILAKPMSDTSN